MEEKKKMHDDKSASKHKTTVGSTSCGTKSSEKCGEKPHKAPDHTKQHK